MSKTATIILAAGQNKRLQSITPAFTKPLLEIGGLPVISYPINACIPYIDILCIVVNPVSYGKTYQIASRLIKDSNIQLVMVMQSEPVSMGNAIKLGLQAIGNDRHVVIMAGDNVITDNLNVINVLSMAKNYGMGFTTKSLPADEAQRFSVLKNGLLREKPKRLKVGTYECWCGPVAFNSSKDALEICKSYPDNLEAIDLMNTYIKVNHFSHTQIQGQWFDIGTPESLIEAKNYLEK